MVTCPRPPTPPSEAPETFSYDPTIGHLLVTDRRTPEERAEAERKERRRRKSGNPNWWKNEQPERPRVAPPHLESTKSSGRAFELPPSRAPSAAAHDVPCVGGTACVTGCVSSALRAFQFLLPRLFLFMALDHYGQHAKCRDDEAGYNERPEPRPNFGLRRGHFGPR